MDNSRPHVPDEQQPPAEPHPPAPTAVPNASIASYIAMREAHEHSLVNNFMYSDPIMSTLHDANEYKRCRILYLQSCLISALAAQQMTTKRRRIEEPRKRRKSVSPGSPKRAKASSSEYSNVAARQRMYKTISTQIPKIAKMVTTWGAAKIGFCKKLAQQAEKEASRKAQTNGNLSFACLYETISKEEVLVSTGHAYGPALSRRLMREAVSFWKLNEKIEKQDAKRAQQLALEQQKQQEDERERQRQERKLNFLLSQTEIFCHFVSSKLARPEDANKLTVPELSNFVVADAVSSDLLGARAVSSNVADAVSSDLADAVSSDLVAQQQESIPPAVPLVERVDLVSQQPLMLTCDLKEYQLRGLQWLASLYEQGINGILADEMGLGKTVQAISLLAWLGEERNVWGPHLVVAPASTLHNWIQEIAKFAPKLKPLPYWGDPTERQSLRQAWSRKKIFAEDSPAHVIVTSYQFAISDLKYLAARQWEYLVLDEAQAIKSATSIRWNALLQLKSRCRLLLTGTPVQNSLKELWALLHFIMPTLFDSHAEFTAWFAKDIENAAASKRPNLLNALQVRRLHQILQPFMLRRLKRDVQAELGEKIEVNVPCILTPAQQRMYDSMKTNISVDEIIATIELKKKKDASSEYDDDDEPRKKRKNPPQNSHLVNLVMQMRKVCNHPELFEESEAKSPFSFVKHNYAHKGLARVDRPVNPIDYIVPRLVCLPLRTPHIVIESPLSGYSLQNIRKLSSLNAHERVLLDSMLVPRGLLPFALFEPSIVPVCSVKLHLALPSLHIYFPKAISPPPLDPLLFISGGKNCMISSPNPNAPWAPMSSVRLLNSNSAYSNVQTQIIMPLAINVPNTDLFNVPCNIRLKDLSTLLFASGKLRALDALLPKLKADNHRCLVYFQMTKMMDIIQIYLKYRKYSYLRLDGSTSIIDRRDLVASWQSNDIFIFLLSTRAGGVGINLTAADTVIFYDSDWNPTVDRQAMDRAHRLGQTKQVTVYRLFTTDTIEERVLDCARTKDHIQNVVVAGSSGGY